MITYSDLNGEVLAQVRKRHRIKQLELAKQAKVHPAHLSLIEQNVVRITLPMRQRLLDALTELGVDTSPLKQNKADG